jgi:adenylosuccinate synthase
MRYQGGANSGHTLYYGGQKMVLHHLPSGVFHPGVQSLMGLGMVITPEVLIREVEQVARLRGTPLSTDELKISPHASLVLPYHERLDQDREQKQKIGTTRRGIGPAYEERTGRRALRVEDAMTLNEAALKSILEGLYQMNFRDDYRPSEVSESLSACQQFREHLGKYVGPVSRLIKESYTARKKILFEGAQAVMLDISSGTYPYVTSSLTGLAGVYNSLSHYVPVERRMGVAKVYCTRVGEGPFPSEMTGKEAERLREEGEEYGATTGRPRRVGWMDLVQLRYAVEACGIQDVWLTKADVLSGYSDVGLVTSYRSGDRKVTTLEGGYEISPDLQAEITWVKGWTSVIDEKGRWSNEMRAYCDRVEAFIGAKVMAVSYGPAREHVAFRDGKDFGHIYS